MSDKGGNVFNFTYYAPTKIHFGKGQISHLAELTESGSRVLLCYGGGSIKRNGIYAEALRVMGEAGLTVFELPDIEPNPRIETVRKGVQLCHDEHIDMVLAIGGGSSIDCAKVVAAGACYDGDAWDLVLHCELIKAALPVYAVLTIAATGSEMDAFAVITDLSKNEKWDAGSPLFIPKMSVLDPTYTFSVPKHQTAAGTADMMSHTFENYFHFEQGCELQDSFAESILKICIKYGPIALEQPDNYEARANLMWASSHAINGLISEGCSPTWCIHPIEHELSAFYDITHGEGLAILTPAWMEYILDDKTAPVFARYARNVWGVEAANDKEAAREAIKLTREFFFETMGMPATLKAVGIEDDIHFAEMAEKAAKGSRGSFVPLSVQDIVEIYQSSLG